MKYPDRTQICEVGPRDGFQFESIPIPTDLKIDVIRMLIDAGLPRIQIASFVHPGRVPQMADAEQVVAAFSGDSRSTLTGLALNERGVIRAAESGLQVVDLSIATNEKHGLDNAGVGVDEGAAQAEVMLLRAAKEGLQAQLGLQTVFGYAEPGDTPLDHVVALAGRFADFEPESISLADTTGLANPESIRRVVSAVRAVVEIDIVLHLHDTRGLGIANIIAAMEEGVTRFDTSLGGLGGCPFIEGAAGNVATEDVVWAMDQLGVSTGVDLSKVAAASRRMAGHLGRKLTGKVYDLV